MTNQIIEVPDIAVVKTVDGAKKLLSLRGQKIKKDENLHNFGAGSGVKYQGDLYVLDSGIFPIVTMVTINTNLSFWVSTNSDIDVDWGDGTREKNVFSHMYIDGASEHEIVFYGKKDALTKLSFQDNGISCLDFGENSALAEFNCPNNLIDYLDFSTLPALKYSLLERNQLTYLNISDNSELITVNCGQNKLACLDVTN